MWDGSADFEWEITSQSDANYASNPNDRRSVTGGVVLLNGASIMVRCNTQKTVTLSTTEAEGSSSVSIAQDDLLCTSCTAVNQVVGEATNVAGGRQQGNVGPG